MQRVTTVVVITLLLAGIGIGMTYLDSPAAAGPASAPAAAQETATDTRWEAFAYGDLLQRREGTDRPYLPFLNAPTLSTGLYVLPAGGDDGQQPHQRDEVYYIVAGRATLEVDGDRRAVEPGDVIFVKAGVAHRFVEIREELQVIVFFAGAPPQP